MKTLFWTVNGLLKFLLTDGDGHMDHLLPGCEDKDCQKSAIYLMRSGTGQVCQLWGCYEQCHVLEKPWTLENMSKEAEQNKIQFCIIEFFILPK